MNIEYEIVRSCENEGGNICVSFSVYLNDKDDDSYDQFHLGYLHSYPHCRRCVTVDEGFVSGLATFFKIPVDKVIEIITKNGLPIYFYNDTEDLRIIVSSADEVEKISQEVVKRISNIIKECCFEAEKMRSGDNIFKTVVARGKPGEYNIFTIES